MGRKKTAAIEVRELTFLYLRAHQIELDEERNARSYAPVGSGYATKGIAQGRQAWTDEQLRTDIEQHGLLQPIGVHQVDEEHYTCVFGYRRLRACQAISEDYPVACTLFELEGEDEDADTFEQLSANLRENMNRRKLKMFELAEALFRMQQLRPELTQTELAQIVSLSQGQCSLLLAIRKKAAPKLWTLFVEYGMDLGRDVNIADLAEVVKLPDSDQVAAWNRLLELRRSRKRKKNVQRYAAQAATIRGWISELGQVKTQGEFTEGVRYALECVLKKQGWKIKSIMRSRAVSSMREQRQATKEEHDDGRATQPTRFRSHQSDPAGLGSD